MNLPLTPNQNYIYQIFKQNQQNQQNTNSNTNYRIPVLNFSKPLNKNNLVMPIINIPKSNPWKFSTFYQKNDDSVLILHILS